MHEPTHRVRRHGVRAGIAAAVLASTMGLTTSTATAAEPPTAPPGAFVIDLCWIVIPGWECAEVLAISGFNQGIPTLLRAPLPK